MIDHVAAAQARITSRFSNSTELLKLIEADAARYDELEGLFQALFTEQSLSQSVGVQLDNMGEFWKLTRETGQSDTEYRAAIYSQIVAYQQSGEAKILLEVMRRAFSNLTKVWLEDLNGAAILLAQVTSYSESADWETNLKAVMNASKAGGVEVDIGVVIENAFYWGDSADADVNGDLPIDTNHGWGDSADADANGDIAPGPGKGGNFGDIF